MNARLLPSHLPRPVVAAPMAGGPSTPHLVAATARAGGLGMLAAGYLDARATIEQVRRVRAEGIDRFGVNVFLTDAEDSRRAMDGRQERLTEFVAGLRPLAEQVGAGIPERPQFTDNDQQATIEALVEEAVPVVSFTFGCPDRAVVRRLQEVGTAVAVGVTDVADAVAAADVGADWLCVQGTEAGGHRFTWSIGEEPNSIGTTELVRAVRAALPVVQLVAAGGLCTAESVQEAFAAGADGVQLGTALLAAQEAGTSEAHRAALADPRFDTTEVTRCFSGRPARALVNEFVRELSPLAPPAYPQVNELTKPVRTAGGKVGDGEMLSLWAGTGWAAARELAGLPVAEIIGRLTAGCLRPAR